MRARSIGRRAARPSRAMPAILPAQWSWTRSRGRRDVGVMARHQQAKLDDVDVGAIGDADDAAFRNHADAVADAQHLLELGGDIEHRAAAIAQREDRVDDETGRAGVKAPRRLERDQNAGIAADLAREYDFLLVAARERADRGIAARHAHAEFPGAGVDKGACAFAIEPTVVRE